MDISKITDFLYVGTQPKGSDYDLLRELDIALIINMIFGRPPYPDSAEPAIQTKWIQTHDRLWRPIPFEALVEGVEAALPIISEGARVFVHCKEGRRRSVAMAASILIAMGRGSSEVMELIKDQRPIADPYAWHIKRKILEFENRYRSSK